MVILPTVQNFPYLFSEATRRPLESVVTLVLPMSELAVAKIGFGRPGRGSQSEPFCVSIPATDATFSGLAIVEDQRVLGLKNRLPIARL